jgi:glutamine amidotransferase
MNHKFSHNCWENFEFNKRHIGNILTNRLTRKRKLKGRVFYNHEYGFVSYESCYDQKIPGDFNKYSSMIIKNNIIGLQFHPEKSQATGLDLLSIIL